MRQLGRPALLAATYNVDTVGIATAAVAELESALVTALDELARVNLVPAGESLAYGQSLCEVTFQVGCVMSGDVPHTAAQCGPGGGPPHAQPCRAGLALGRRAWCPDGSCAPPHLHELKLERAVGEGFRVLDLGFRV